MLIIECPDGKLYPVSSIILYSVGLGLCNILFNNWFNIVIIALDFIITIVLIKYKPMYKVNIAGEEIGYVENTQELEEKVVSKIENMLKSEALILKKFNKEKIKEKYKTIENYKQTLNKMKNIKYAHHLLLPYKYPSRQFRFQPPHIPFP